ncbi:MAG: protein of unknown function YibQ [Firmicutes bacterium]|nr:protein of unknown function YibQ [Bacillota bacterium]
MAKKRSSRGWVLIALVILAAVLYFQATHKTTQDTTSSEQLFQLEKTGSGVVADYTAASKKIHDKVDAVLDKEKLKAEQIDSSERKVPRTKVEGSITWSARQFVVILPPEKGIEAFTQSLSAELANVKGEVLASEADTFNEQAVTRLDIGIRDTLEGDPLTLVTDKIYIIKEKPGQTGQEAPSESGILVDPPSGSGKAKLAFVIDDFGYSSEPIEAYAAINRPLTFSVLPNRQFTNEAAARGISSGHQVMLHLPMQPMSASEQSEATTITVDMSDADIRETASKAVHAIPGLIGVNNHQGSRATADARVMKNVLQVMKANSLFFVDSRTSGSSVAYQSARQMGVLTTENDLFIDNQSDVGYIKGQIRKGMHIALQNGSAVLIGHARMHTAQAIREMIPELEAAGIRLVFVSQLVR